ncbi:GNAT family N-acetyltransferase [Paenibacillus pabuli]|uniref:Ribosomal protein S18 acetylase RimI-like enzyme n=2 Tax=Paenibacillus TaxID=44249 RepID=A0A855XWE2_9BACL|nr:GNAT family N-acetyltransferase [Paenibacillus pabuli]PWW39951.1 ribosomal protein S18 acetylase RimI-like enzyme [Paenibacillus pabuli]PXW06583.1 ribosomal protein S18 acetylase RimI-like enzyme [Paenibacillus taichungensis]
MAPIYSYRSLMNEDLKNISSFPQSKEELFYISPRFKYPLTPDQILKLLENRYEPTVIVDEESGQVVAYANLYDYKDDVCWLGNVIVSKDFRGKDAANYLLKTMIMKAKSIYKVKHLLLSCHSTNSRGIAFYHKQGFKPIDMRITDLDEQKIITLLMRLEI